MARRTKKRRTVKKRRSKTLTQRVAALEKAIRPQRAGRRPTVRFNSKGEGTVKHFTPPHVLRQMGMA